MLLLKYKEKWIFGKITEMLWHKAIGPLKWQPVATLISDFFWGKVAFFILYKYCKNNLGGFYEEGK